MLFRITFLPFLLVAVTLIAHAQKCPDLYKRFSSEHSFCKPPNKSCTIKNRGVTDEDKELIVKVHNDYRSKVATGKETSGGGMPEATNMLEMVWDDELAAVAQKHAEDCQFEHDCDSCRRVQAFSVGQNIGKSSRLSEAPDSADWKKFIDGLYDEVSRFSKEWIKPYVPGPDDEKTQYGHFTQLVWATSWKVGCGWAIFEEGGSLTSLTVCNYGPGGNLDGGEMYKTGDTCSACPKNSCCGKSCDESGVTADYSGLCKVIDESTSPEGPGPHGDDDYYYYCDFNGQSDCATSVEGKAWTMVKTSGGNWLSAVVKGGEKTELTFDKSFEVKDAFCLQVEIRSASNVDGQGGSFKGVNHFDTGSWKPELPLRFTTDDKDLRQDFVQLGYGLDITEPTTIKYTFKYSVPANSPPQFVEIKRVSAVKGNCV